MNLSFFVVVVLLFWLKSASYAQQSRIVAPPESVNAALNITVHFTCTAIAVDIEWKVNGDSITPDHRNKGFDDSSPMMTLNFTQNLHMSTIAVLGSADNNRSNITCVALSVSAPFILESEPAVLLVFKPGLSGPVSNLTVSLINSTTFHISWSPPFTLEGVPILGYNVTITNTTSGENETMLLNSTCHSDPQTSLLYSIDHPDPEYNFIVTVVPINKFGAGQPATCAHFSQPAGGSSTSILIPTTVELKSVLMTSLAHNSSTFITIFTSTVSTSPLSSTFVLAVTTTPSSTPPTPFPILIVSSVASAGGAVLVLCCIFLVGVIITCCCSKRSKRRREGISVINVQLSSLEVSCNEKFTKTESSPSLLENQDVFTCTSLYETKSDHLSKCDEEIEGFVVIETPSLSGKVSLAETSETERVAVKEQVHYAVLGDFSKLQAPAPLAPIPLEKVIYADVSPSTHERTYGNTGDQKRSASLCRVPTKEEREEIARVVKHKWRLIGFQLGVDNKDLNEIAKEHSSNDTQCSLELFKRWACNELSADSPFVWRKVIETLDGSYVREAALARELEEKIIKLVTN